MTTWEFPRIVAVEVEGADDVEVELLSEGHLLEVIVEELLFGWMEPESRKVQL